MHDYIDDSAETRLRIALRNIAAYWSEMLPAGPRARSTGTIGRTDNPHLGPIPAHVLDVRRDALETLHFYTRVVLTERSEHYEMPGRLDATDGISLARFLDPHVSWIAQHELADAAADDFTVLAGRIQGVARPHLRDEAFFVGPCECGERIHAPAQIQLISCPQCGRVTERSELREAAHAVGRQQHFTAAEAAVFGAATGKPVKRNTITSWARRRSDALEVAMHNRAGQPMYRWSDIEARLDKSLQRA